MTSSVAWWRARTAAIISRFPVRATPWRRWQGLPTDSALSRVSASLFRAQRRVRVSRPAPGVPDVARGRAGYANLSLGIGAVLRPAFGVAAVARAAALLSECLPGGELVRVESRDLIVGLGALHCLTQPEPAPRPASSPA